MKVVLKIIAALALLLSVDVSAYTLDKQTQQNQENVKYVNLLFDAIFNIANLQQDRNTVFNYTDISVNDTTALCLDIYVLKNIQILAVGGGKIRKCVHASGWELKQYFASNSADALSANFSAQFDVCAQLGYSDDIIDCYGDAISSVFSAINSSNTDYYLHNRNCFSNKLAQTFQKLDKSNVDLQYCVKDVSAIPAFVNASNWNDVTSWLQFSTASITPIPTLPILTAIPVVPTQPNLPSVETTAAPASSIQTTAAPTAAPSVQTTSAPIAAPSVQTTAAATAAPSVQTTASEVSETTLLTTVAPESTTEAVKTTTENPISVWWHNIWKDIMHSL